MEAVAAAASIAGIITLVFQSIDGLVKFKELFADASAASKTVDALNSDINSLIQTLEDAWHILEKIEAQKATINFASLDIKLADCSQDISIWLSTAKLLRPTGEHGGKAWLKKFRLAVNKNAVQGVRNEISRHRQIISLSLSVLGRNIDLENSGQIYRIESSVSRSLSSFDVQDAALERIETMSKTSLQNSAQSISCMESMRSELSRLESMIMEKKTTEASQPANHANNHQEEHLSIGGSVSSSTPTGSQISAARVGAANKGKGPASFVSDHHSHRSAQRRSTESHSFNNMRLQNPGVTKDVRSSTSFLYASYTASNTTTLPPDDDEVDDQAYDCMSTYHQVQRSLVTAYPESVARLIELHQMLDLLRKQERFLDAASDSCGGFSTPGASYTSHLNLLRQQITELEHVFTVAESRCKLDGHPVSKLQQVLENVYS